MALGICTASSDTRIDAFKVCARKVLGTVGVKDTFWSAVWWFSDMVWLARACHCVLGALTNGVRTAGRVETRIDWVVMIN
jgi:hypothetical protein